ncbi:MAG TPA: phosphatase PAP2 family protein [Longimicrobiales bacterium]|nr:phosphatase PAP2 family protein [Longimicrobiales bacterium]
MNTGARREPADARAEPIRALALLRAIPWLLLLGGWILAYAIGVGVGLLVRALGWWNGDAWERTILVWVHATISPALDVVMLSAPWLGTNYSLAPIVAIAAVWLWIKGRRVSAAHLAVVQLGSALLNPALKFTLVRNRPTLFELRGQFALPSFPSGHAIAVTAVVLTAAYLVYRTGHGRWGYVVAAFFWLIVIYSRIYLAVHWPTDVVAGLAVGAVWLAATLGTFAPLHDRAPGGG